MLRFQKARQLYSVTRLEDRGIQPYEGEETRKRPHPHWRDWASAKTKEKKEMKPCRGLIRLFIILDYLEAKGPSRRHMVVNAGSSVSWGNISGA